VLFSLYSLVLIYAISRLVLLVYHRVQNSTLRFYYVNLAVLLLARMLYFSDAFVNHWALEAYFVFSLLPTICLFTANTVLAFMWYKYYVQ
jgi:hypothetical protein